jgi:hypothetical protein
MNINIAIAPVEAFGSATRLGTNETRSTTQVMIANGRTGG